MGDDLEPMARDDPVAGLEGDEAGGDREAGLAGHAQHLVGADGIEVVEAVVEDDLDLHVEATVAQPSGRKDRVRGALGWLVQDRATTIG